MLKRIVILNSATYGKAIVRLDDCDSIQLVGPNNVGKSTLVFSLNFLFIIDGKKMTFVDNRTGDKETISRDISIFFAILCYEMDKQGKNFLNGLQYSEHSFEEVNLLFENSSYIDLIQTNKQIKDTDARRKLLFNTMNKKNIIEKINDDKFTFTPAYKVFIDFAEELAKTKTTENNIEETN